MSRSGCWNGEESSGPGHRPRGDPAGLSRHLSGSPHAPEELADATLDGTRKTYLADLAAVPLLIIDDLGMRKLPHTAAEDLLEIIMRRYERASTLLTSNRPVDDWGKLLGDTAAVTALLDRLLHHAHVLKCGPRSRRTKVQTDLRTEEATK
jgi:DNA replication protein DnaC